MDDKDPFVRSIAACGLAKYKRGPWEKAAIASLVVALEDEAYDVRLEAASSLLRSRIQLAPEVESVVEDIQRQEWEKAASAGHPLR